MKISVVVTDVRQTARQLVTAMANGLKAADNFAGDGKTGQVLTSTGPNTPPSWQDASAGGGPVDVSRLVGIINATNIVGAYPGITGVGPLSGLIVNGAANFASGISVVGISSFIGMTTFTDGVHTVTLVDGTQACITTGSGGTTHLSDGTYGVHTTGPGQFDSTLGVTGVATFVSDISVGGRVEITGAAGTNRDLHYQTAGLDRWILRTGNTAESGSNAGSNFFIFAFDDTGAAIDSPLSIVRAAGGAISIPAARSLSHSTGVIIGLLATAKIGLDGTDGAFVSGENSLFESGGNIFASVRGGFLIAASNISVAGRVVFRVNVGNTGATNILSLTDGGAFAVVGTGSFSSQLVVGTTTPINVLDVRTGVSGAWGQYATITSSATTAYQGGLLHTNVTSGIAGNNSFKMVATFTSATASKRFRMGWVDNSATETWLDSANAAVEFGPLGTIGIMTAAQASSVVKFTGSVVALTGVIQHCFDIDFQNNSAGTTEGAALFVRGGTAAAAFTLASAYGIRIATPLLGAGSTITTATGLKIDSITTGGTNNFAIQTSAGIVVFGDKTGVGVTPAPSTNASFSIGSTGQTGTSQYAMNTSNFIGTIAATAEIIGGRFAVQTAAAAFTVATLAAIRIVDATLGAGSTITTQYGLLIDDQTKGATSIGIKVSQGTVATAILVSQLSGVTNAALTIAGGTVTGASAPSVISISQTWNTTGAPTAIKLNITNTASNAASKLFDFQVGGVSALNMTATGTITLTQTATTTVDGIDITGGTITGSSSPAAIFISQEWNTTGTPIALAMSITNTAASALAKFINMTGPGSASAYFQIAGTELLGLIPKAGQTGILLTTTTTSTGLNIQLPANSTSAAILVGGASSQTGATGYALIQVGQLWNTTGAPTGILLQINNTASAAAARLLDLQIIGTGSKFAVDVAGNLYIAATQVVSTRATGWTAWTGTATRTSKATGTATLVNVAEAVKALIDDLIHHGLIGP